MFWFTTLIILSIKEGKCAGQDKNKIYNDGGSRIM